MEEVKIDYMKRAQFGNGKDKLWFLNDLDKELFGDRDLYAPTLEKEEEEKNIVRIRKYMSLENVLNLLDTNELYLANPKVWADPFESLFIKAEYEMEEGRSLHFNDLLPDSKFLYCTCFTSGFQSDAQWSMYNDGEIGVLIDFDAQKLFYELAQYHSDLYIGKVKYLEGGWQIARDLAETTRQIIKDTQHKNHLAVMLGLMLRKRINYEYEKEIRLMYLKKPASKKNEDGLGGSKLGINIKIKKMKECITLIRIDPRLGPRTTKAVKDALKKYFDGQVSKSGMNFKASFKEPIKL